MLYETEYVEECVIEEDFIDQDDEFEEPRIKKHRQSYGIPISQNTARAIYNMSGTVVNSVDGQLTVDPTPVVIKDDDSIIIEEVRNEMKVPYEFNDVQKNALHALLNGKNVVVNSPCGSGKLSIFTAGVLGLRKKRNNHKLFGIILEPLVAISEEKRKGNPPVSVAFIDLKGHSKVSDNTLNVTDDIVKDIEEGKIACVFMSAEAMLSQKGTTMVKSWRQNLVLGCTDEAQLYLDEQWGSPDFRGDMNRAPGDFVFPYFYKSNLN